MDISKPGEAEQKSEMGKNWVFTLNNPKPDEDPTQWPHMRYVVFQLEKAPTTGTEHYQGYIVFDQNMRLAALKKINKRASWRIRRGTHEQARAYCVKEDSRVTPPVEVGDPPVKQGKRSDIQALWQDAKDGKSDMELSEAHGGAFMRYHKGASFIRTLYAGQRANRTELVIYWGPQGTGKSSRALYEYPDAYWLPPVSGRVWWDGYQGQETVIIDEFFGQIPIRYMCRLIDGYPLQVEYKGGSTKFVSKRVVITSNVDPFTWWQGPIYGMDRRLRSAKIEKMTKVIDHQWGPEDVSVAPLVSGVTQVLDDDESPSEPGAKKRKVVNPDDPQIIETEGGAQLVTFRTEPVVHHSQAQCKEPDCHNRAWFKDGYCVYHTWDA